MILGINYADERFKPTQKFNTKYMKKHGIDSVIEYTLADIPAGFKKQHKYRGTLQKD